MTEILTPVASTGAAAVSWTVDREASSVGFRVRHFGVATVSGTFARFAGRLDATGMSGTVATASIETGNAVRDRRLASSEFLDSERFAEIAFASSETLADTIRGELTIRGVTRPVTLAVSTRRIGADAVAVRARGRISRSEFGLEWSALVDAGRVIVSDRVDLILDLVLVPDRA